MNPRKWNTYKIVGYSYDAAQDQRSAGGIHAHQVRKTRDGWQHRIRQANGVHEAYSDVSPMTDAEGAAAYATALQL